MFKNIRSSLPAAVGYLAIVITMGDKLMIHPVNSAHAPPGGMVASQHDNEIIALHTPLHTPLHVPHETGHKPHHPEVPEEPLSFPPHVDPTKERRITLKRENGEQRIKDRHSLFMPPEPYPFKFTFREVPLDNWKLWQIAEQQKKLLKYKAMLQDIICVSGGFDPLHSGHLAMFREAAKKGKLVVIINSDDWLMRKKGFCFLTWEQRADIISSLKMVHEVASVEDKDNTVCEALKRLKPKYFANGGDRKTDNTPEMEVCNELGIEMVWDTGGEKFESSSEIAKRVLASVDQ